MLGFNPKFLYCQSHVLPSWLFFDVRNYVKLTQRRSPSGLNSWFMGDVKLGVSHSSQHFKTMKSINYDSNFQICILILFSSNLHVAAVHSYNCKTAADGAYEISCQSYTKCVNGTATTVECHPPEVVNAETGLCDRY